MAQGRGVWLAGMAGHGCAPNSTQKQVRREQALREQTAAVVSKHANGMEIGGERPSCEFTCDEADVFIGDNDDGAGAGFHTDRAGATPLHQGSRTGIEDNEPPEQISQCSEYGTDEFNLVRVNANRTTAEVNVRDNKWFVRVPSGKWGGRFKWDGPFTGREMVDWYEAGDLRFTQPWGSIMDGAGGVWSTAGAICRARWENDIAWWEKHAARWENQVHSGRAEAKGSRTL